MPGRYEGWWVNARFGGQLHYRIGTRNNFARMWRIAHAFFAECERRGFDVATAHSGYGKCQGGVTVSRGGFSTEITFHERGRNGPPEQTTWGTRRTIEPTGLLQLITDHSPTGGGVVLAADGEKRWRLEERVGRAVEKLEETAAKRLETIQRAHQRDLERQRERDPAEARRREEQLATERRDHLIGLARRHRTATDIRLMVTEVHRDTETPSQRLTTWLEWALAEAESIDPVGVGIEEQIWR